MLKKYGIMYYVPNKNNAINYLGIIGEHFKLGKVRVMIHKKLYFNF